MTIFALVLMSITFAASAGNLRIHRTQAKLSTDPCDRNGNGIIDSNRQTGLHWCNSSDSPPGSIMATPYYESNNIARSAVGFSTANIDGQFYRMNISADNEISRQQASQFVTHVGSLGGARAIPWIRYSGADRHISDATHIMYKDELAQPNEWKITEWSNKAQVLGGGDAASKVWLAKTTCDAGSAICGEGKWIELNATGAEIPTPNATTALGR